MSYRVVIPRAARKHLDALPEQPRTRVLQKLGELAVEPRLPGSLKLKGYADEYRVRVGDYRIRYRINDKAGEVVLIDVRHRKDIYRE